MSILRELNEALTEAFIAHETYQFGHKLTENLAATAIAAYRNDYKTRVAVQAKVAGVMQVIAPVLERHGVQRLIDDTEALRTGGDQAEEHF